MPKPLALALAISVTLISLPVLSDSGPSQTTVAAGPASTVLVDSEASSSADSLLEEADPDALFAAGSRDASERSDARSGSGYGDSVVEPDAVMVGDGVPEDEADTDRSSRPEEASLDELALGGTASGDSEARASGGANRANSAADAEGSSSATTSAPAPATEPEPSQVTPATTSPPSTAAPTTAPSTTAAPTTAPTTAATAAPAADGATAGEPTAAQWQALRQCEAWGDYTVVSGNGLYFGAYQFSQPTWDTTARAAGRNDLVGVPPNQVAPADQDAIALALWRQAGWSPWPHCGKQARGA